MKINDETAVSRYKFGTETADFYVCAVCGAVPFVASEIDGKLHAVVNVNTFEDTGDLPISDSPTNFDGESTDTRLGRRKRNWIPTVQLSGSAISSDPHVP